MMRATCLMLCCLFAAIAQAKEVIIYPGEAPVSPLPAAPPSAEEKLEEKIDAMRFEIKKLQAKLKDAKEELTRTRRETTPRVGYQNYFLAGFAVLRPFAHTFGAPVGSVGCGALLGGGRYLSPHHVLELTVDYDLYLSATLRYRYEFHPSNAPIALGLVAGIKQKLLGVLSWGNYISRNDLISSNYLLLGGQLSFPVGKDSFAFEIDYLRNHESVMTGAFSVQVFL